MGHVQSDEHSKDKDLFARSPKAEDKTTEKGMQPVGGSVKGSIELRVTGVSKWHTAAVNQNHRMYNVEPQVKTECYSEPVTVGGIDWKLLVAKENQSLKAYLGPHKNDSAMWSVYASVEFILVNDDPNFERTITKKIEHNFDRSGARGISMADLATVCDKTKGFIRDDVVTVRALFELSAFHGIKLRPSFDLTSRENPMFDVTLVFGEKRLHAGKQVLASHSPVFYTMFYGNFDERNKDEIELKDVDVDEFTDLLNVIYPSFHDVTEENLLYLLKLGDMYEMKLILDRCESFLIESSSLNIVEKLRLSDVYRLVHSQGHCLRSLKTVKEVTDLEKIEAYETLSDTVQANLMYKVMRLANE